MEAALLDKASGMAESIVEELVAMRRPAYVLGLRLTGSPEDAEDAVQQAYLHACSSLRNGTPPQNARAWFLTVVANAAKNHLRDSERRARRAATVQEIGQAASSGTDPEMLTALRAALEVLDPESRALVSLCYEHGCSQSEAAGILGMPARTASHRLRAGLERLQTALAAAGFTAGSTAIVGGLAYTAPPEPAGLATRIGSLVARETTASSLGGGAAAAAPGGGLAMKVVLGIAAAGALAAGVATVDLAGGRSEPRETGAAPAAAGPAQGAPKFEHFAFASDTGFLDGPSLEALGSGNGGFPTTDSEGNVYLICKYSTCRIRCLRADGRTETIAGDDRWPGNLDLAEGPAEYFPNRWNGPRAGNYSIPGALLAVYGLPLKGEDQGRIYFHWQGRSPYRIFKNKEKNDRWWFRRLGTPGSPKPPTTVGQTVKLEDVDLTDAKIRPGIVAWQGNVYEFDEPKGEMTCSFTLADYEPKAQEFLRVNRGRTGKPLGPPEHYIRTDDGSVFLLYYWRIYDVQGQVFRMSPDRKQFEHIIGDVTDKELRKTLGSANFDGPGLLTTWHCGPADISFSGNTLLTHSIDSTIIRRWKDGRVSSLCRDGEWRENPGRAGGGTVVAGYYQAGHHGNNYFYLNSTGETGDSRVYRLGPVDLTKPTVGPLQEAPGPRKEEGGAK